MSLISWLSVRCAGVSLIVLFVLCFCAVLEAARDSRGCRRHLSYDTWQETNCSLHASYTLAFYSVLVHCCVVAFQLRACWAVLETTKGLRKATRQASWAKSKLQQGWKASSESLPSSKSSSSRSSRSSMDGWGTEDSENDLELVTHAILIPNYKEDIEILVETLDILAAHPQARYAYDVYLAMESREQDASSKASQLVARFQNKFIRIQATFHPCDIEGESPGKSSNLSWAAKRASEQYKLEVRRDVILTSIDADSHLSWRLFSEITAMHLACPDTSSKTLYAVPIIFDRNANQVPAVVRVADVGWSAAGLSGHYKGSCINPPTSVYSIPLELADRVGGWDTGPEAIGEDLHMWLKCFFALRGNLTVHPVACPVSQTNIVGSGSVIDGVKARYRQAFRHMWGSLDSGYALGQLSQVWQQRHRKGQICWPMHFTQKEIDADDTFTHAMPILYEDTNWSAMFFLLHRLFEAHFMPGHIFILVIATSVHRYLSPNGVGAIASLFKLTDTLSTIGTCCTIFFFCYYHVYYQLALELRRPEKGNEVKLWRHLLDCIWLPVVAPLYGSFPAIQAQLMHFWTIDLVYVVSKKSVGAKVG